MAIVSDYMIYGNCKSCGKYLAQGTFCCEGVVQSNYTVWLENMMNKKKEPTERVKLPLPKPALGGIKFLKEIMGQHGEAYYDRIKAENERIRRTYPLVFAKDKDNPAYYHIILSELFNNNLVTLEQYVLITESIQNKFTKGEEQ
ncbi:hypothetical protein QCM8_263 [Bacillus phage QCM8]|nr:hypothetical protein QCM8_263 [Bacillus phage QCM8]